METMLELLVIVGIILSAAILYYVYKIYQKSLKKGDPKISHPPTLLPGDELEALLNAKEKAFFTKFANLSIKDPQGKAVRTVTMTQSIIQAITIQVVSSPPGIGRDDVKKPEGKVVINAKTPWQLSADLSTGEEEEDPVASNKQARMMTRSLKTSGYQSGNCSQAVIDFDQLVAQDQAYETFVGTIISPGTLGAVCLCPTGEGWCNWSSEMLDQFIVDTDVWNLTSIEVFDILTGNLLSTSSMNQVISSPRNHVLVQMSNPAVLQNLSPGQKIVVLFKWLDRITSEPRCIELFNEMP